jgi:fructose-1,6-bisphosphatase/inositol monophosphatase family enzyme
VDTPTSDLSPDPADVLALFASICDETAQILADNADWGPSGRRDGQYAVDLEIDAACIPPLLDAGFAVLSEESGITWPDGAEQDLHAAQIVVVDPLDGSTNASIGLPWCNTALCLVRGDVPSVAMVSNLVTGERFHAVRDGGAFCDGERVSVAPPRPLGEAMVAINGLPGHHWGWRQFRSMGSGELDVCSVAIGRFDAYIDATPRGSHGVWDYIAGGLVVEEAGGVVADVFGRDLVVLDHEARRAPVAASGRELLDELVRERRADGE